MQGLGTLRHAGAPRRHRRDDRQLRNALCASTTCATPSAPWPYRSSRSRTSKAYMGHADIATTMIYVHHAPQHDVADRLSRRLAKASTAAVVLDAAESHRHPDRKVGVTFPGGGPEQRGQEDNRPALWRPPVRAVQNGKRPLRGRGDEALGSGRHHRQCAHARRDRERTAAPRRPRRCRRTSAPAASSPRSVAAPAFPMPPKSRHKPPRGHPDGGARSGRMGQRERQSPL